MRSEAAPSGAPRGARAPDRGEVRVVLFTGGRGSRLLSRELVRHPHVHLTLLVNGYDDGKSTGEIRRFLGDSLGPSDYRKNAGWLAGELGTASAELLELLAYRFPVDCPGDAARAALDRIAVDAGAGGERPAAGVAPPSDVDLERLCGLAPLVRDTLGRAAARLLGEVEASGREPSYRDCSLGNLVFAGLYLDEERSFNRAVRAYTRLLGLPDHLIENVTDGRNAWLVGVTEGGGLLATEEEIVDAARPSRIREIFLVDRPLGPQRSSDLAGLPADEMVSRLRELESPMRPNPAALASLREADLIVFAPGTQHSSLYPSYLTTGVGPAIAGNETALKLLITNIEEDAEIFESTAVDLIERAVFYLQEKDRHAIPTPFLITHYVIHDPTEADGERPYLPLGPVERLEDPRLARIGNYEDGVTGRHNAARILIPFVESRLERRRRPAVAVLLLETRSANKIAQTMVEALRGGIADVPVDCTLYYSCPEPIDVSFSGRLPFRAVNVHSPDRPSDGVTLEACEDDRVDYFVLFDSSGMYRGEDIVNIVSHLTWGRLDAVWGSRRLFVHEIHESYRLRYRHTPLLGAVSYLGSHLLSVSYLLLYGRYVSDTLSGVRAVRAEQLREAGVDLDDPCLNQRLLSRVLRAGGEIFETPVRFFPISPRLVRRTGVSDGLRSLWIILGSRLGGRSRRRADAHGAAGPGSLPAASAPDPLA